MSRSAALDGLLRAIALAILGIIMVKSTAVDLSFTDAIDVLDRAATVGDCEPGRF